MNWRGALVTVTGGAGFLGGHLVERLDALGAEVRVVDNLSAPNAVRSGHGRFVRADILDLEQVRTAVEGTEVVYHMAAISNPRACIAEPARAFDVNVLGLKNVLEAARGARRIVFLSSAAVYGEPVRVPIDEAHPLNGRDAYARSKLAGEQVCGMYASAGTSVTVVRNFNSFGPRQSPEFLIPQIITQALLEGRVEIWNRDPIRDFLYVDDLVSALLAIVESESLAGETINVGSGVGHRAGEMAERLSALLGVPLVYLDRPVPGSSALVADVRKLQERTDWVVTIPLEVGLERTVAYYREWGADGWSRAASSRRLEVGDRASSRERRR